MNGISTQMIFSPQNCSLDLLDKTLTADRRKLTKQILARIQGSIQTKTSHYSLIIGARGTGKTHLLTYIWKYLHAQYANDPSLKIISLAEEERGITSLLDFLVACMRSVGIPSDVVASRIRDGGYPSPAEAARELFHEVVKAKSTLIVIENLGYIFESLEEDGLADLRGFLQDHPSISVLASSVTLFSDSSKADHPFYGFFNIHPLKPLDRKDARMYLLIQSRAKGDAELATVLEKKESQARVNAIYDLTGGNHRLLAMLSTFLSAASLAELVGPFVQMADRELTPYYQQRLDRLSPQQNKLVRVITDHHGRALSVNEIAHAAFLTSQSVSRQLYDLLHGGYVVRNQVGRESCYELREPLLRLVLDIKEGRNRPLSLIVNFLRNWYSVEELSKLVAAAPLHVQRYYDAALTEKKQAKEDKITEGYTLHERGTMLKEKLDQDILRKAVIAAKSSEWTTLSEFFEQFFEEVPEEPIVWLTGAVVLHLSGRLEDALAAYDEVVKRFSDSDRVELLEPVAKALFNKSVTLDELKRGEETLAAYDEVVRRFGHSDRVELLGAVAKALVSKGVTLDELKRSEEAIAVYDEVVKRFGHSDRVELLESVAMALVNKGVALAELQRSEEAIAVYDEVVKRFGHSDRVEFLESIARALFNKGFTLDELKRSEEAIAVYDEVVKRFGHSDRVELLEPVAKALSSKGLILAELQRGEEAITVFDEVVKRFGHSDRVELLGPVAGILGACIEILASSGREDDALSYLKDMLRRVPSTHWSRTLIVSRLLDTSIQDEKRLRQMVALYKDDADSLINGLISWVQNLMPLKRSDAEKLEDAEKMLQSVFAELPDAAPALQLLNAARRDALGDRKALLDLPIEIRRLIKPDSTKE